MSGKHFFNSVSRILVADSPNWIYCGEADYFASTLSFCYLTFESLKIIGRQIPFLKGLRFLHPRNISPGTSHKSVIVASLNKNEAHGVKDILNMSSKPLEDGVSESFIENPKKKIKLSFDNELTSSFSDPTLKPNFLFCEQPENRYLKNIRSKKTRETKVCNDFEFQKAYGRHSSPKPNYFVAVKVSNFEIHGAVKQIQEHISSQDSRVTDCMISVPTLHITLMVMNIEDNETHKRAMKALTNVHQEHNDIMCNEPLTLEFCGLGDFRNKVVYAKIKENESYRRLSKLAESVQKHFAGFEIFSTDKRRGFNPHLTIAKIDFTKKSQRALKKIDPSLYEEFIDLHLGSETIRSIQLLKMSGPKSSTGYYTGDELFFSEVCDGTKEI